jgi:hypothetical protein
MSTMMYLVLAIPVATTGLAAEIPAELQQAIRARDEAVAKKDASTRDRLTMSDFMVVRPEGKLIRARDGNRRSGIDPSTVCRPNP